MPRIRRTPPRRIRRPLINNAPGRPRGSFMRRQRRPMSPQSGDAWNRAGSRALTAAAYGGAGIALAYAGAQAAGAIGDAIHGPGPATIDDRLKVTEQGTYVLGEDGSTKFVPSQTYIDNTGIPPYPIEVGAEESDVKEAFSDFFEKLLAPGTILIVGLVILAFFYLKGGKK